MGCTLHGELGQVLEREERSPAVHTAPEYPPSCDDATSRSMSSGAARRSPRRRARASVTVVTVVGQATARMLASTTSTLGPNGRHCSSQRKRAPGPSAGVVEHLVQRGSARLLDQSRQQVLLQGLVGRGRPLAEDGMRVLGRVLDLSAGHAAICRQSATARASRPGWHASVVGGHRQVAMAFDPLRGLTAVTDTAPGRAARPRLGDAGALVRTVGAQGWRTRATRSRT